MEKIITKRLSIIVSFVLGSGTGWGLSGFIEAAEIKQWLTGVAVAFSLMLSLIISAYYKTKRSKLNKEKFWKYSIGSAIIFFVMLTAFFMCYNSFETRLRINVPQLNDSTITVDSVFIKGLYFTAEAKNEINKQKQNNNASQVDLQELMMDSNSNINDVWNKTSRTLAKVIVLFSYIFFIAALIACITITTEILADKGRRRVRARVPPPRKVRTGKYPRK